MTGQLTSFATEVRLTHYRINPYNADGSKIAFAVRRTDNPNVMDMYVIRPDGSDLVELANNGDWDPHDGARAMWDPDGVNLYYTTSSNNVAVVNTNTLAADPNIVTGVKPQQLRPDGSQFLYLSAGSADVKVIDIDGTNDTVIVTTAQANAVLTAFATEIAADQPVFQNPSYSPDGTTLFVVFSNEHLQDPPTVKELLTFDPDGANLTYIPSDFKNHPSWSPDGAQIIFNAASGLSIIDADGSNETLISSTGVGHPLMSPDGQTIATDTFGAAPFGEALLVTNVDNGVTQKLIDVPNTGGYDVSAGGIHSSPMWNKQGTALVYISDATGVAQLYSAPFPARVAGYLPSRPRTIPVAEDRRWRNVRQRGLEA